VKENLKPCRTACAEDTDCKGFTFDAWGDKLCELRSGNVSETGGFGKGVYKIAER
jgi:hypothetical protein